MAKPPPPAHASRAHRLILKEAERQGLTAYALAGKAGLSINTVRSFLLAERAPTLPTAEAIAKALGLTIDVRAAEKGKP